MAFLVSIFKLNRPWAHALRFVCLVGICGVLNHLRDLIVDGADAKTLLANTIDASFTAVPSVLFLLVLVEKMNRLQRELSYQAMTDQLTGLPNRRAFFERARPKHPPQQPPIVAILDIDHFKRINDTYGHLVGDECLRRLGLIIRAQAGKKTAMCRYGGEEFASILLGVSLEDAVMHANKFSEGETMEIEGHMIQITYSIGLAEWTPDLSLEDALRLADGALYRAKEDGRKRAYSAAPQDLADDAFIKPTAATRQMSRSPDLIASHS